MGVYRYVVGVLYYAGDAYYCPAPGLNRVYRFMYVYLNILGLPSCILFTSSDFTVMYLDLVYFLCHFHLVLD